MTIRPMNMPAKFLPKPMASLFMLIALAAAVWSPRPSHAEITIDITRGNVEPLPIAVTDFVGKSSIASRAGRDIAGVIAANLERSGLFRPIDRKAFIQSAGALDALPPGGRGLSAGAGLGPLTVRAAAGRRRRAAACAQTETHQACAH